MPGTAKAPKDWPATPVILKVERMPAGVGAVGVEQREFAGETRADGTVFVGDQRFDGEGLAGSVAASAGSTHASSIGACPSGRSLRCPANAAAPPTGAARAAGARIEAAVEAHLFEQIGAANGGFERGQAELREQ